MRCLQAVLVATLELLLCEGSDPPELKPSKHVEALDHIKFADQVTPNIDLKSPPYWPFVMFHVSWCKHCKHALPEFHKAAGMIHKADLSDYPANPKFFTIECDNPLEKTICEQYVGSSFPSLMIFREGKFIKFDRPRLAQTIAWWGSRMSRPALYEVPHKQAIEEMSRSEPIFVIQVPDVESKQVVAAWSRIALGFMDRYTFGIVNDIMLARDLNLGPMQIFAPKTYGLETLKFEGAISDEEDLRKWVQFNRHPPMTQIGPYTASEISSSGLPVVVLVISGKDSQDPDRINSFKERARLIRKRDTQSVLWGTLNLTEEHNLDMLQHNWPLVEDAPRVFAFAGTPSKDPRYWEDSSLIHPGNVTAASVAALLASEWALHEDSVISWGKDKGKRYVRLATGSTLGLLAAIAMPLLFLSCCSWCCSALMAIDAEIEDDEFPPREIKATKPKDE